MTDLTPTDDGLAAPDLESALAWERARIEQWVHQGDWQSIVEMRRKLDAYKKVVATLAGDVDTALLEQVTEGPMVVDGQEFSAVDDGGWSVTAGDRLGLMRDTISHHVDDPTVASAIAADLAVVLPGSWTPRWGSNEKTGVGSLDLNPRDYRVWVVKGAKLAVKPVES